MNTLYALHGFLNLPSAWNFLGNAVQAVDIYHVAGPQASFEEWAASFNRSISPGLHNILMGYSLGGRLALHALLDQPRLWKAAIIVSAHPGLKSAEEKEMRKQSDRVWAQRFLQDPWPSLMQQWNSQAVFSHTTHLDRQEADFSRTELAHALTDWSLGVQADLQGAIEQLDLPLLWMAGANDVKFAALAQGLHLKHPLSQVIIVPQAGHRLLWDAPEKFEQTIQHFIEDCYAYEDNLA